MGKFNEAENAYKKAIELYEEPAYPWSSLANLYRDHLGKYNEAENAYKKAIALDKKLTGPWNGLGNLYADYLSQYVKSEAAYIKALKIDPTDEPAKYNLVFLWRDRMNKIKEAKGLFNTLTISDTAKDSYLLNKALFAFYEKNIGIAEELLKEALLTVGEVIPAHTKDDWYRAAVVTVKLGFGSNLLSVLTANGYDILFKPFYVAIEALTKNEDDLFFNSIAAEVREPARKIMEIMKDYMD